MKDGSPITVLDLVMFALILGAVFIADEYFPRPTERAQPEVVIAPPTQEE
jgi:hypothetical protein